MSRQSGRLKTSEERSASAAQRASDAWAIATMAERDRAVLVLGTPSQERSALLADVGEQLCAHGFRVSEVSARQASPRTLQRIIAKLCNSSASDPSTLAQVLAKGQGDTRIVMLLDDADEATDDVLRYVGLTSGLFAAHQAPLQLVLGGRPGLHARLDDAALTPLREAVGLVWRTEEEEGLSRPVRDHVRPGGATDVTGDSTPSVGGMIGLGAGLAVACLAALLGLPAGFDVPKPGRDASPAPVYPKIVSSDPRAGASGVPSLDMDHMSPAPALDTVGSVVAAGQRPPPPTTETAGLTFARPRHQAGLVLVAAAGDALPVLYRRVYRGVTPPPYEDVAALNPATLQAGSLVVFPTPPDGWRRRAATRRSAARPGSH